MIVHAFAQLPGNSHFTETNLVTDMHAHPALEVVIAREGTFMLTTPTAKRTGLRAAIIPAHRPHALHARAATVDILLWESVLLDTPRLVDELPPLLQAPHCTDTQRAAQLFAQLSAVRIESYYRRYDERVEAVLHQLHRAAPADLPNLRTLARQTYLSPDRLSHLFSTQTGLPLQRYLIWLRLKHSVHNLLHERMHLTAAAHAAGFYDAAHFSRLFRAHFGLAPFAVYNSGIVQG